MLKTVEAVREREREREYNFNKLGFICCASKIANANKKTAVLAIVKEIEFNRII